MDKQQINSLSDSRSHTILSSSCHSHVETSQPQYKCYGIN